MPTAAKMSDRSAESANLLAADQATRSERLVKSAARVRDLGEVFTPAETVQSMLDLLPADIWASHPSPTFLEPACGDGNFLVAILDRKLDRIGTEWAAGVLAGGSGHDALQFHALQALASIYAVDLSSENIEGGTPGHEVGARERLITHLVSWYVTTADGRLSKTSPFMRAARWIVDRNVQVANMLEFNADGTRSGRDEIPLVEYQWDPPNLRVRLFTTTLGAVMQAAAADSDAALTLFGPPSPVEAWAGKASRLMDAPVVAAASNVRHARNGKRAG